MPKVPRWPLPTVIGLFLVVGLAVGAWSIGLPYYAFSPGPVGDAQDSITVSEGVEVFMPKGEILMLTVSVQEVNPYEAFSAVIDPAVDLVRAELLRQPDESDEDFRRRGLEQMDRSKETAISVALARLGLDLPILSDGVRVADVVPGLPAADVLQPDDLLLSVDGAPITIVDDIRVALEGRRPGDFIVVVVERAGSSVEARVELAAAEDDPNRAIVGILVETINPRFPVDIQSANVGGPSAGLMYALSIIDLLSEGELTGGRIIAGTGTIQPDGTVGAIGGIRQKVVAAEAAGATVMFVPGDNYAQALTAPRSSIELVRVDSIDDALAYLAAAA
ncbi:MAG: PDZ domain-containing protein [Acidimicrobiia bacterium]|nr:PDZ domain-containing protein [Acidimicrobiia bacterium]